MLSNDVLLLVATNYYKSSCHRKVVLRDPIECLTCALRHFFVIWMAWIQLEENFFRRQVPSLVHVRL